MPRARKKLLSIIVPAYKQQRTIRKDLSNIDKTLSKGLPSEYDYEIICVVDGIVDNTEREAKKVRSRKVHIYAYPENAGKGHAVRFGMSKAKGYLISFLDAGREISPRGIMMLMAHMQWYNADIIVGSKKHPASIVRYPLMRRIMSFGYYLLCKILLDISVKDTQSGIKIFKRRVVKIILPRLLVKRYAMDVEMLAVANYLGFKRIYEAPIEIHYKFEDLTHASTIKSIIRMVWDTLAVFYRLRILHYYDDKK